MHIALRRRLKRLEVRYPSATEEIQRSALRAISDEDLHRLEEFIARDVALPEATSEEKAALERYFADLCDSYSATISRPSPRSAKH